MQEKDRQSNIFWAIFGAAFVLVGIASIAYGIALIVDDRNFKKTAKETMAVITEIHKSRDSEGYEEHKVHVKFSADGKEYKGELDSWSPEMKKGKEVKVYYNPDNPQNLRGDGISISSLISVPIGTLFFLIGFICFIILYKQRKRESLKGDNRHYEDPRRNADAVQKKSKRSTNTIFLALLAFFILVLIGVIAGGIALVVKDKNFKKTAKETMATITEIYTYRDSGGDTSHRVYVKFSVDGEEYEGKLGSYHLGMQKGQEVKICYNPDNPQIFNDGNTSIAGFVLIALGTICLIACLAGFIIFKKNANRQNDNNEQVLTIN